MNAKLKVKKNPSVDMEGLVKTEMGVTGAVVQTGTPTMALKGPDAQVSAHDSFPSQVLTFMSSY